MSNDDEAHDSCVASSGPPSTLPNENISQPGNSEPGDLYPIRARAKFGQLGCYLAPPSSESLGMQP